MKPPSNKGRLLFVLLVMEKQIRRIREISKFRSLDVQREEMDSNPAKHHCTTATEPQRRQLRKKNKTVPGREKFALKTASPKVLPDSNDLIRPTKTSAGEIPSDGGAPQKLPRIALTAALLLSSL